MLDDVATAVVEDIFDRLLGRQRNRTALEQFRPFLAVVGPLLAIAVAVSSGP